MGIKNLMSVIKKHCDEDTWNNVMPLTTVSKPVNAETSRVAVDTSLLLYKYRHASTINNKDLHIVGFINRVIFYLQSKIIPIFIFDGKPPDEKTNTLLERKNHKEKIEAQINDLQEKLEKTEENESKQDLEKQIDSIKKSVVYVTKEHFEDVRTILGFMGIPYFDPSESGLGGEAEHICASLQKKGVVDHVVSDDTDTFAFGATSILRTASKGHVNHLFLGSILRGLEMNYKEFVDFCIICGCDYCGTVSKVGPVGAYSAIKKYKNIETWLDNMNENIKKHPSVIEFRSKYEKARELFTCDYENIPNDLSAKLDKFKETEFVNFLKMRNWEATAVNKAVKKYKNVRSKL
tara:strand:+ start:7527 stop:8573 length:1047 start_codon:yes stop_codon:yes gene_type:complete